MKKNLPHPHICLEPQRAVEKMRGKMGVPFFPHTALKKIFSASFLCPEFLFPLDGVGVRVFGVLF
ncbi:TPA: hypothetical protein VBN66_001821 [Streptococcus agalactiae]|nr:hypothetical protein [Streptococcus agalactiae]